MTRPLRPIVLLALGGLALSLSLSACKKDPDPQAVPIPSGTAAVVAPPGAAEAASAAATVPATPPPPTTPPPPVAVAPVAQASIDSCCAALSAVSKSGRGKEAKSKSAAAAKICSGIAKLVKEGKTARASAMTQIRSQLGGIDVPSECH